MLLEHSGLNTSSISLAPRKSAKLADMEETVKSLEERYSRLEGMFPQMNGANASLLKKMEEMTVQSSRLARSGQDSGILGHSPQGSQRNNPITLRPFGYVPKLEFPN